MLNALVVSPGRSELPGGPIGIYPRIKGVFVRALLFPFAVASTAWLAANSCSPSPRFFEALLHHEWVNSSLFAT